MEETPEDVPPEQKGLDDRLIEQGADGEVVAWAQQHLDFKNKVLLRTMENPGKGSMVVKASFKERDLNQKMDGTFPNGLLKGQTKDLTYKRPAMLDTGTESNFWSDQVMTNWRAAVKHNGGAVKDLKFMAQDNVITPETQKIIDGVFEQMANRVEQMDSGVEQKLIVNKASTGSELAAFDAMGGTVHGRPVLRMLEDYHLELGNKQVKSWHLMNTGPDAQQKFRFDMVIEFDP